MQKIFSFKGITRNTDNLLAQEGECMDVVNMRMVNGSLEPFPQPHVKASLPVAYSEAYWHAMAGCNICITADGGELHFYDREWKPLAMEWQAGDALKGVKRVEFVGNVVCCFTDNAVEYLLYDSGHYRLLGQRPPVPVLDILPESKLMRVTTDAKYAIKTTLSNLEASWEYNEKGYIDKCVSLLNMDGYYVDRALFRFGLRMYDGSYIYTSHVIYVCDQTFDDGVGRDSDNMQSESQGAVDGYADFRVTVRGFKPEFSLRNLNIEGWKGIVTGIDVFTTGSIPGKRLDTVHGIHRDPGEGNATQVVKEKYVARSLDELHDDILSASLFYKVAEFDIYGGLISSLEDVSDVNLALQQALQPQQVSATLAGYSAGCSYVLNNRLHAAALKEHFFKGYDASSLVPAGKNRAAVEGIVVHTKIETSGGTYVVENNLGRIDVGHGHGTYELPPLLSYPDSRATEMIVYLYDDTELFMKRFPLVPHRYMNMSMYLHKWHSSYIVTVEMRFVNGIQEASIEDDVVLEIFGAAPGVHTVVYSAAEGSWMYNGKRFPDEKYSTYRIFAIPRDAVDGDALVFTVEKATEDSAFTDIYNIPFDSTWELMCGTIPDVDDDVCEDRGNVLKVAATDNPFVFPPEATFAPSQERVVAMASNTVALSQGQFGEHPLYLFCNDGIWALAVDASGSVAYSGCFPLSRERCVNAASVCGIDSGVVFAGEEGLMLLRGSSIKRISAQMDDVSSCGEVLSGKIFGKLASIVSMEGCAEKTDFRTYLSNARICYLAAHKELLLFCAGCGYSYLFSLEYASWGRLSWSADCFVKGSYTHGMIVAGESAVTVMQLENAVSGSNRVMLFTRPMLWGTKLRKRIMQLMLHCSAISRQGDTSDIPAVACYMLCSNDGINYKLTAGVEKEGSCRDVVFPWYPSQSYSHYVFAVIGNMGENSILTALEADINVAWNNRLG